MRPLALLGAVNQRFREMGLGLQLTITGLQSGSGEFQVNVSARPQGQHDFVPIMHVPCTLLKEEPVPTRAPQIQGIRTG